MSNREKKIIVTWVAISILGFSNTSVVPLISSTKVALWYHNNTQINTQDIFPNMKDSRGWTSRKAIKIPATKAGIP